MNRRLQRRKATMRTFLKHAVSLGLAIAVAGCDGGPRSTTATTRITHGANYGNTDTQRRFKEAIAAAKIPHELEKDDEGREFVRWTDENDVAVKRLQESLFGRPMPPGNNVRYLDGNEPFKAWLTANGIPFKTSISHGSEYVITAVEDEPRVAKYQTECKGANGHATATATPAPPVPQGEGPPVKRGCGQLGR